MSGGLRLWTAPFSTNAERVEIALAVKGLDAERVVIDYGDRSAVERLSGQGLVPVLEHEGQVIADSMAIVAHLEERFPEPPLYPSDPARRAEIEVFIDWFNRVWKVAPNAIADGAGDAAAHSAEIRASLDRFDALLHGRPYLFGEVLTAADVCAYPFLKYAIMRNQADTEAFHLVLEEQTRLEPRHSRVRDWLERVSRVL